MRLVGVIHLDICWVSLGLAQVEAADHENAHNSPQARRSCVSRRRGGLCSTPESLSRLIFSAMRLWASTGDSGSRSSLFHSSVRRDHCLRLTHAPTAFPGAASFTIYTETKDYFRVHGYLNRNSVLDAALAGGIGGAMSGSLISFGSARASPHFDL